LEIKWETVMNSGELQAKRRNIGPDAVAPDGSEVRILCGTARGGMAEFCLRPGEVASAIVHRTVDEIWYVLSGTGRMWRASAARSETLALTPGLCVTIPVGTRFQFRCDRSEPLIILGLTMPPWPGGEEAVFVEGEWEATVRG
jgi:mannose-6-phosphate isomerase-like protein (cupin superfamily)